ncbi:MAG: hypothetical protein R2799_09780 [Crocinitomicaceae bacterium]
MIKFFKNIIAFSSVFAFGVVFLISVQSFILSRGNNFKLPHGTDAVILGHSHASCAYNDTLIKGVVNLAEPMEGYYYSYFKLKQILRYNKLKFVFVEYANNQITKYADDRIFGEYIGNQFPKMLAFIEPRALIKLGLKNPIGVAKNLPVALQMNLEFMVEGSGDYVQAFWSNDHISDHVMQDVQKKMKTVQNDASKSGIITNSYSVSEMNLFYLAQIANLCKKNGIQLYFLRAPVSKYEHLPMESTFQEILNQEFPEVPFIDLKDFPVVDEDFADPQHMNIYGAKKVSVYLNELIEQAIRTHNLTIDEFLNHH